MNGDEREGQEDAEDSAQGSARRHSQDVWRDKRIAEDTLVGRASRRQGRPYDDSDEYAGPAHPFDNGHGSRVDLRQGAG